MTNIKNISTVPHVIKQTNNGERGYDIFSRILEDRIIMLCDEVNKDTAQLVIAQLLYLESVDPKKDITLYINSPGGSVSDGLAIYDTMNFIKCDVATVCVGHAASMGAFLLSGGTKGKRFALPNAEVMIHQPSGGARGQATDICIHAENILRTKQKLNKILAENATIVVNVSLGAAPKMVTMPNLENRSKEWALSYLEEQKMDLKIEIKAEHNDIIEENSIIKTEPKEGAKLTNGQTITLWVSQGKKIAFGGMPMVVNNTKDEATKILEDQGLGLKIVYDEVWDMTIPAGIVMETTPTRGERLKTGQTVTLKISKGIEQKVMPDLTGMELSKAKQRLVSLGFKEPAVVYVDSDQPKDTVLTQSLEKDKEHQITSDISLEVSNGSKAPVTRDVTIDLRNSALFGDCHISISRDGTTIYSGRVPKGTVSVTLPNQTAVGTAKYTIIINETDGWDVMEVFTVNG